MITTYAIIFTTCLYYVYNTPISWHNEIVGSERMKVKIEIDRDLIEDEVIIRCQSLNDEIQRIERSIHDVKSKPRIRFYQKDIEYYISLDEILFFETEGNLMIAHTRNDVYQVKRRLYELEELLPSYFIRVSKSTILNIHHIYSITKNITASSIVEFNKSHKQVYVSRMYYKILEQRLEERRNYEI